MNDRDYAFMFSVVIMVAFVVLSFALITGSKNDDERIMYLECLKSSQNQDCSKVLSSTKGDSK